MPAVPKPDHAKQVRKSVTRRNVLRHTTEWVRAYGSPERVAFVAGLPSVVSGHGPCENVHVRSGGTSRKADACWIVPMTKAEHHELHQLGARTFAKHYDLDLLALAEETDRAWRALVTA